MKRLTYRYLDGRTLKKDVKEIKNKEKKQKKT